MGDVGLFGGGGGLSGESAVGRAFASKSGGVGGALCEEGARRQLVADIGFGDGGSSFGGGAKGTVAEGDDGGGEACRRRRGEGGSALECGEHGGVP